jgi:TonB family protein
VVFNVRNYDISPWAKRVLLSVHKHWNIPLVTRTKADQPLEVLVIISKKGKITSMDVKQTSNANAFDNSAISALHRSQPFPDLPDDFPALSLEARFIFTRQAIAQ